MTGITTIVTLVSVFLFSGMAHAATANVQWNKDGSITFKKNTYYVYNGDTGNASNSILHLLTKNEAHPDCPSSEIVFPAGSDLKTAKKATFQKNYYSPALLCTPISGSYVSLTITNTRPGPSTTGSDTLTNGITQDGTQQPSAADLASCSTANGYAPDPAVCGTPCKNADNCDLTAKYINPFINKLLAPLAILAVIIGVIWGAIEYIMSGGDSQKVAQAKNRIQKALVGLVAFIFLYALLNWLIPGGLLP